MDFEVAKEVSFENMDGSRSGENMPLDKRIQQIQQEISRCQENISEIEKDTEKLKSAECESKQMALKFSERIEILHKRREDHEQDTKEMTFKLQMELEDFEEEHSELMSTVKNLEAELKALEAEEVHLQEQIKVSKAVPERKMIFKGKVEEGKEDTASRFDVNPQIYYPLEGGAAVITFEESDVAQNILDRKEHEVEVGECRIKVTAHPVELPCPTYAEPDLSAFCPVHQTRK